MENFWAASTDCTCSQLALLTVLEAGSGDAGPSVNDQRFSKAQAPMDWQKDAAGIHLLPLLPEGLLMGFLVLGLSVLIYQRAHGT